MLSTTFTQMQPTNNFIYHVPTTKTVITFLHIMKIYDWLNVVPKLFNKSNINKADKTLSY